MGFSDGAKQWRTRLPMQETGDVRFDPWVGKIPPTESGLAQKDQETVGRDAVCIQNLLPTSFQFQGLLPLWFWELGKREGPFDLNGSMSAAGRFPWSCSGLADYWGCSTERCVHRVLNPALCTYTLDCCHCPLTSLPPLQKNTYVCIERQFSGVVKSKNCS